MLRDTVSGKNTDTQCGDKSTEHAEAAMSTIATDVGAACTIRCMTAVGRWELEDHEGVVGGGTGRRR